MLSRWVIVPLLAGVAIGLAIGWAWWRSGAAQQRVHHERAARLILWRLAAVPPGGVIVIGDSITAAQDLTGLCGGPVFNGSIGGAQMPDMAGIACTVLAAARPRIAIFALGTNDAQQGPDRDWARWSAEDAAMVRDAAPAIILVGIAATGAPGYARADVAVRNAADAAGVRYVKPAIRAAETLDGIHRNATGARTWRAAVEAACASSA